MLMLKLPSRMGSNDNGHEIATELTRIRSATAADRPAKERKNNRTSKF